MELWRAELHIIGPWLACHITAVIIGLKTGVQINIVERDLQVYAVRELQCSVCLCFLSPSRLMLLAFIQWYRWNVSWGLGIHFVLTLEVKNGVVTSVACLQPLSFHFQQFTNYEYMSTVLSQKGSTHFCHIESMFTPWCSMVSVGHKQ